MQTKRSVAPIGSRRTNVLILGVILVVVAITVSPLAWQRSATLLPAQLSSDTPAVRPALDQHERHAAGFPSDIYTPLDQHERHADLVARIPNPVALDQHERHQDAYVHANTPLDQHERHADLVARIPNPVALDQHERHPDLVTAKAEPVALLDAFDRYLAARNRRDTHCTLSLARSEGAWPSKESPALTTISQPRTQQRRNDDRVALPMCRGAKEYAGITERRVEWLGSRNRVFRGPEAPEPPVGSKVSL